LNVSVVLDQAHFDHMTGADRVLQAEVALLFRNQVAGWDTALESEEACRDALHTIKGSARGIGLHALAGACETAEAAPDIDRAAALASVRAALDQALIALKLYAA
jgi:HPt (histidine-containing phosphotransfer) domain-containing protein